jgi:hypothetical protein
VDADLILDGFVAKIVGSPVMNAGLDAAAGEPGAERPRVVVPARFAACLGHRQPAELAATQN